VGGTTKSVYEFGSFRLDPDERLLLRHGTALPLTPKLFETLLLLVENSGHLLLKDEMMKNLWPDSFVDEVNLSQNVSRLRKILEETPGQRFIATVAGRGYRFVADVRQVPADDEAPKALVIESHTRESVVFEEADEDDLAAGNVVVTPALPVPAGRKLPHAYWLIPIAVTVATLAWFALPPKPPRVLASARITNDGRLKWPKWQQSYEGPQLLTDGSRIYTTEDKGFASWQRTLVQVPVSGGETVPIPLPFGPRFKITDMSRQRSELLLLNWQGLGQEGPLWTYSVVHGGYRRVGDLNVSDATWDADGHILFTRGEELWSADFDGSEKRFLVKVPGIPYALRASPDRRIIRFTLTESQTHSTSLWEVSRDGKNPHPLLPDWTHSPRECCGSWTPDGSYYVFQSFRDGRYGIWALPKEDRLLGRYRGPFQLTTGPMDYVAPSVSLDGKQLFAVGMQSRNELLRFDREKNQFVPFLRELSATSVAFSKDGEWVAYTSDVDGQLWRARVDGSNRQQLTFPPSIAAFPSWSPDGKRIAFVRGLRGKRNWKIYVVPAEGGSAIDLLPDSLMEFDPTWSPDGKKLAFAPLPGGFGSVGSELAILTVDLETREISKIPGSAGLFSPRWSPGGQLAAVTGVAKHLVIYDATKQTWSELLDTKVAFPRWSHDDKYIYFDTLNGIVCRVDVHSRKIERITSLENLRMGGPLGAWSGLTPDDIPLFTRDAGSQEIYAFDLELP
jgi:Tol biopolymer transport system component/DNA-binding winged helix-turn-helix (wHTH) protein